MNSANETIVSGSFMKKLRSAGLDEGYEPVPKNLQREATRILGGKDVADMPKGFRGLAKKAAVAAGNRKRENGLKEARARLIAEGILS